jgi:hypothetical protein|nr:MAG TPA: homing endonuclease [Caudoviricetes sp.]
MEEEFKEIIGYEGWYWVSNLGNVKSKFKQLKPCINKDGYYVVSLCKENRVKTFSIHRLVALHFIDNPDNLPQVNHKDECKTNNCVTNLEWCTQQQNHDYGTRNERTGRSQMNKQGSKALLQYDLQGNFIKEFPSVSEASRELGKSQANISRCANGFKNQAYGFIWKFKK